MTEGFDFSALSGAGRVLCAVSGGADSVYLLHRCLEGAEAGGYAVCAAHYNHSLRGEESDRDESFVADMCAALGVECVTGRGDVAAFAAERRLGTEEAARQLRYEFLSSAADSLGADLIATAHNAGDNAETLLLNLTRGSGLRGLGGIPPRRGRIVRPMLAVTRAEVEEYLSARGIAYMEDSTNALDDYSRNRIRHSVMPVLRGINPRFDLAAGRAAALMRADEEFLESLARSFVEKNSDSLGLSAAALASAPRSVSSRAVRLLAPRALSEAHVDAVLALSEGTGTAFADVPGARFVRENGRIRALTEMPGGITAREIPMSGEIELPEAGLVLRSSDSVYRGEINSSLNTFFFPYSKICCTIYCMSGQPGDALRIARRGCTKKLSDLFAEARIPALSRPLVPVLRDGEGVLAVYGLASAERAAPKPGERTLKIEFAKIN